MVLRQRANGRRIKLIDRKHERVVHAFTKFPLARVRLNTLLRSGVGCRRSRALLMVCALCLKPSTHWQLSTLRFLVDSRRPEKEAKEAEVVMVHYFGNLMPPPRPVAVLPVTMAVAWSVSTQSL